MVETSISRDAVMAALATVQEPELHQDLVSLNMIHNLDIQDHAVKFDIMLTTPACPLKGKIEADARRAVLGIAGREDGCHQTGCQRAYRWPCKRPYDAASKKRGGSGFR